MKESDRQKKQELVKFAESPSVKKRVPLEKGEGQSKRKGEGRSVTTRVVPFPFDLTDVLSHW